MTEDPDPFSLSESPGATVAGAPRAPGYDVIVIGASAGGLPASIAILRSLPEDFSVPILLMLHLPLEVTLQQFFERLPFETAWVRTGSILGPRKLLLCPARSCVELLPDGSCVVSPCEGGALDRPIDRLFDSVARSFGPQAIGVILSGMMDDGALGARELHLNGGQVLVQNPKTAEYPDMPTAAIRAGAANLVVPLSDIGQVLVELCEGVPRPKARSEIDAIRRTFGQQGQVARLAQEIDWSTTPVGAVLGWPEELRLMVRAAQEAPYPKVIWWGPEFVQIYNDVWGRALGITRHSQILGTPARETWPQFWPDLWHDFGSMADRVRRRGEAVRHDDFRMLIDREGFLEEVFGSLTLSPIFASDGAVVGVQNTFWETTGHIVAERRMRALHLLSARLTGVTTPQETGERAAAALETDLADVPFALLYLLDKGCREGTLCGAAGVEAGTVMAPRRIRLLAEDAVWPLARVVSAPGEPVATSVGIDDLQARFPGLKPHASLPGGTLAPQRARLIPLYSGGNRPRAVLIVGLSSHRPFDEEYASFVNLLSQQIAASLSETQARQIERERLDRLAELDRAKTEFFSNVSHEFRTPLTLLLAPLEDLVRQREALPPGLAGEVEVAARNARRLLRLVNSLLDFSAMDLRWQRAPVEVTDLGGLTTDIASAFRSAIEAAGLRFQVEIDPSLPPVPVNRDLWEKIVSNLLSNAFKFTFEGQITVRLRPLRQHAELEVTDTGVGIPQQEWSNIFQRFHRVQGTRARTAEGAGIGLSIVQDLVKRLGGQLTVHSIVERGTTFTIWLPYTSRNQAPAEPEIVRAPTLASDLAEEASRWLADEEMPHEVAEEILGPPPSAGTREGRILVADDNGDLRDYLGKLLRGRWDVLLTADGEEALTAVRNWQPDLLLADVMMPGMDGFELLKRIRAEEKLKTLPVVLVTARAGEESAIEGLLAGADDYIAKPFSARELIARVGAQLELSRVRRQATEVNEFLVRFSDAVRGLTDPAEVAQVACQMIHRQLDVERAYWGEVDWSTREWVIRGGSHSPGVSVVTGRFPLDGWEPNISWQLAGKPVVVDDTQADPRLPTSVKEGYAQIAVGADLAIPVLVDGKLRCTLSVNQCDPRPWTPEEIALVESVAARCWAEVERARAEAALRASEEQQKFLLKLTDALRPLTDTGAIEAQATRLLGEYLQADRTFLTEVDEDGMTLHVREENLRSGASSVLGDYRFDQFGEFVGRELHAGRILAVEDVAAREDLDAAERANYAAVGIQAYLLIPLIRNGRLAAYFTINHRTAREWSEADKAVARQTADRTWASIARVRAEEALRRSEGRLRALFESIDEGFSEMQVLLDEEGHVVDWLHLALNGNFSRVTGIPDITGRLASEVFPNLEGEWFRRMDLAYRTGEPQRFETELTELGRWFDNYITRVGGEDDNRVFGVFGDITERKRREQQQEFLLKFSDDLRTLGEAKTIEETGVRMLAEYLRLDRAYVFVLYPAEDRAVVRSEQRAAHLASLVGEVRMSDFPETVVRIEEETLVVNDTDSDARLSALNRASLHAVNLQAFVCASVRKDEKTVVWSLAAVSATPRTWTKAEVELIEIVAERIWATAERAKAEEALRTSEEKYRTLFETIDEGFVIQEVVLDSGGRIVDMIYREANAALEAHTGLSEVNGKRASELFPQLEQDWLDVLRRVRQTGIPERAEGYNSDLNRWISAHYSRVGGAESPFLTAVFSDITERKERERQQELLLKFSDAMRPLADAQAITETACRLLVEHLDANRAAYTEVEGEFGAEFSVMRGEYVRTGAPMPPRFPLAAYGESLVAISRQGEALIINDIDTDPRVNAEQRASFHAADSAAVIAASLVKEKRWLATFGVHSTKPRNWTPLEIALVEDVAERTWAAVERARAEEALRASEERLRRVLEGMGEHVATMALHTDISERKSAEEALRAAQERGER